MAARPKQFFLNGGELKVVGVSIRGYLDSIFVIGLFFSCIVICLLGVLYEGIKWLRVYLHNVQLAKERQATTW